MQQQPLPIVAIGGINFTDAPAIATTGVNGVAMISTFTHANEQQLVTEIAKIKQVFANN